MSDQDAISVAATKKPRRGRPRRFNNKNVQFLVDMTARHIKSERGKQNYVLAIRALGILQDDPQCEWLAGHDVMYNNHKPLPRQAILTELGRIDNDEAMLATARRICEMRPTAKEGAAKIRHWRTGKRSGGDVRSLTKRLAITYDLYRIQHPGMTDDQASTAVTWFKQTVDKVIADQEARV